MGLLERAKSALKRASQRLWRREKYRSTEFLREMANKQGLPMWAVKKVIEHNITHVFEETGKKPVWRADKGEILGEIFVRDYLAWVADRAGREDLLEAVRSGRYFEKKVLKQFKEAERIAFSRALREILSRSTPFHQAEIESAIKIYNKIITTPELAREVKKALEERYVELPRDIVERYDLPEKDLPRSLELIREAMASRALWKPPGWNV